SREAVEGHYRTADLLMVPSLWPEPFGLVGPEAGAHGLPAVGFPVGGIPEWLRDGVNGHLAEGPPGRPEELAAAAMRALSDGQHYQALRRGAREVAGEYGLAGHVERLVRELAVDS